MEWWSNGVEAEVSAVGTAFCRRVSVGRGRAGRLQKKSALVSLGRGISQKGGDFVLDRLDFIQTQFWIGHDENITGARMFVDERPVGASVFGLDLFENAFALEHYRQNIA